MAGYTELGKGIATCPNCGKRVEGAILGEPAQKSGGLPVIVVPEGKSVATARAYALILGFFGAHNFYLGRNLALTVVLVLTALAWPVALVEAFLMRPASTVEATKQAANPVRYFKCPRCRVVSEWQS